MLRLNLLSLFAYRLTSAVAAAVFAVAAAAADAAASQTSANDAYSLPHQLINGNVSARCPGFADARRNSPIVGRRFRKLQKLLRVLK